MLSLQMKRRFIFNLPLLNIILCTCSLCCFFVVYECQSQYNFFFSRYMTIKRKICVSGVIFTIEIVAFVFVFILFYFYMNVVKTGWNKSNNWRIAASTNLCPNNKYVCACIMEELQTKPLIHCNTALVLLSV